MVLYTVLVLVLYLGSMYGIAQEREESDGDVTGALTSAARPLTSSTALDSDGSRYLVPQGTDLIF